MSQGLRDPAVLLRKKRCANTTLALQSIEVIVKIPEPLHNGLSPSCASFYVPEPANA
jgi:hypothetical protein